MVYVISHDGKALMPTKRYGKVRRLLRDGLAVVVSREPFTIKLNYEAKDYTQAVTLGIDTGSKTVGVSATTKTNELYSAEVVLRDNVTKLISTRKEYRIARRNRKTRYRKTRFNNRKRTNGNLSPSIKTKLDEHLQIIRKVCCKLPIRKIIVEVGQFDTQLIKDPEIQGEDYQKGEQLRYRNVREYVLARDKHKCQHCKGRTKDKNLNVHHIESRKYGGNAPNNLITLCRTCHKAYHQGKFTLKKKRGSSLKDATFMSVIRWKVYERLKDEYKDKEVHLTYGYITKHKRVSNEIKKTHCSDAFCISGNVKAKQLETYYQIRCVARHTRSLHCSKPKKGGFRRSCIASHWIGVSRFQKYDLVIYNGNEYFIFGSTNGRLVLRDIQGNPLAPYRPVNTKLVTLKYRKRGGFIYQLSKK